MRVLDDIFNGTWGIENGVADGRRFVGFKGHLLRFPFLGI